MKKFRFIVAHPESQIRNKWERIINQHEGFEVAATASDLMCTYTEVEHRTPHAVLIADALTDKPEFEVMRALFSALDVRWLIIGARQGRRLTQIPAKADLFSLPEDANNTAMLQQIESLVKNTFVASIPNPKTNAYARNSRKIDPSQKPEKDKSTRHCQGPVSQSGNLILIGASTGGVEALISVLSHFDETCPPTLVVQHTGSGFGRSLVDLLDRQTRPQIRLADGPFPLRPGVVVLGAGNRRHLVMADCKKSICNLGDDQPVSGHVPSADVLFQSAVPMARQVTAALLTGMGRDGAEGLLALRRSGATTVAQDQASSVVYGMPRAAAEIGAAEHILPLNKIGPALLAQACAPAPKGKEFSR